MFSSCTSVAGVMVLAFGRSVWLLHMPSEAVASMTVGPRQMGFAGNQMADPERLEEHRQWLD